LDALRRAVLDLLDLLLTLGRVPDVRDAGVPASDASTDYDTQGVQHLSCAA
jgi:hypothetical protein